MSAGGDEGNPYAAPRVAVDLVEPPPADTGGFRSLTPLAQAIVAAMGILILLDLLGVVNRLVAISALHRALADQPFETAELRAVAQRGRIMASATTVVRLVTFVIFCFFLPRANRNVRSFGVGPLQYSPRGTVGFMFVPIVNLFATYLAVKEIWQGSSRGAVFPRNERVSPLVRWWWAMYLISVGSPWMVRSLNDLFGEAQSAETLISRYWHEVAMMALAVISAALFAALVHALARRQDERQRRRLVDTEQPVTAGAAP
jgi:hypothetical protein